MLSRFLILITFLTTLSASATAAETIRALTYPTPSYSNDAQKKLIARGEYLTKMGDCIACHTDTKKNGPVFAGGLEIKTPFGSIYTPNITPDKKTGIGTWSDDEFVRAMQQGISPKGEYYFPVFPFPSFTRTTRDDLLAIKAYLLSIPPVSQETAKPDMYFPLNWRFLQLGWRILFFNPHQGVYQYDNKKSAEWNRGAYIVQGFGHCGECHTPRNVLGAMKYDYALTGAFVEGYYAPDITSVGLAGVLPKKVLNVFKHNEKLRGAGSVGGPMLEVNVDSLKYLTDADLKAIVTYLETVKSKEPPKKAAGSGEDIYTEYCAICHDNGAAGAPKIGDGSAWSARLKEVGGLTMLIQHAISGINSMPPRGTCVTCTDADIKSAVDYILENSKGTGGSGAAMAYNPPKLTEAQGKKIYDNNCIVCHAEGKLGAPKLGDKAAWEPLIAKNMDVLIKHTLQGYRRMPPRGTCIHCTDGEIIAAVKYMVQQGKTNGNYSLW